MSINYYMIMKRLKSIELSSRAKSPLLQVFIKNIGKKGYIASDTNNKFTKDKEFKNKEDITDYLYKRAEQLDIPKTDIISPLLLDIVDNSDLESVMYSANR